MKDKIEVHYISICQKGTAEEYVANSVITLPIQDAQAFIEAIPKNLRITELEDLPDVYDSNSIFDIGEEFV